MPFMPVYLSDAPVSLFRRTLIFYVRCPVNIIALIVIAGIHALHINFPVVDLVGQGRRRTATFLMDPSDLR